MLADGLSKLFEDPAEFRSTKLTGRAVSPENLFSMLETLEDASCWDILPFTPYDDAQRESEEEYTSTRPLSSNTNSSVRPHETDVDEDEASLARKKLKFVAAAADDGQGKMSHVTVERNRRKQVNDHLLLLRSLMPSFYVNRGDQASIIGGVVDYIKELQQVLQSMEAKKQRKVVYSDQVLSPRPPLPLSSPRPSPLSPRIRLPISPTTPQSGSPYKPRPVPYLSPANIAPSSSHDSFLSLDSCAEQAAAANSKSPVADVEVKFAGPNVLLNTVSHRIPGQTTRIITALEGHSLEILQMNINSLDDTTLNSFTIKIGIECELSAEELAQEILQTFS